MKTNTAEKHLVGKSVRVLLAAVLAIGFAVATTQLLSAQASRASQPVVTQGNTDLNRAQQSVVPQPAPERDLVKCKATFAPAAVSGGTRYTAMTCVSHWFGSFTAVPAGQFLSITNVVVTPWKSAATSVTGLTLYKSGGQGSVDDYNVRVTGGSTHNDSFRSPALVLTPGSTLYYSTWADTNTDGELMINGFLTGDYNGGIQ